MKTKEWKKDKKRYKYRVKCFHNFYEVHIFYQFKFRLPIPIQVVGSITGVRYIIKTFPEIGLGPHLTVDIHRGALTEGLLTFAIVTISLGLARKIPGSFFMKTWISSVSKLTLHILGSDLTGGCMNPASVSFKLENLFPNVAPQL